MMQNILLLHGAVGSKDQLTELQNNLKGTFAVHLINFSGHGDAPANTQPFSIPLFARDVLSYLDENEIETINIFGYSMGGYVAMYLAIHHPTRINKIITLATKFKWNATIAAKENTMLQPEKIEELLPAFAHSLQKRHLPNDWKTVLQKTTAMLTEMGKNNPIKPEEFVDIHNQTMLMLGDKDSMVTLDETLHIYKNLAHAQLAVLPNSAHPIDMVNMESLVNELKTFLH